MFEVAKEILGHPCDPMHIFGYNFGVQIVDRMPWVLKKDEI